MIVENGTSVENEYKNKSFLKSRLILLCNKVKLSKVRKANLAKKFSNLVVSTTPSSSMGQQPNQRIFPLVFCSKKKFFLHFVPLHLKFHYWWRQYL